MKFVAKVFIQKPREEVVSLWQNPDNLHLWQDGFQSMEVLEGEPGKVGSKSLMKYKSDRQNIILEETILENKLPDSFAGVYKAKQMTNTMHNRFEEKEGGTLWTAEIVYNEFNGFMPKLMARLMPGMFRKQTQKWLDQFKAFAEGQ